MPHIFNKVDSCGGEFELRIKNQLNQRAIAKECSNWVKEKVTFKTSKHSLGRLSIEISSKKSLNIL